MSRLTTLRLFVAVADSGSFSDAARTMRVSPAAATRAVALVEADLGVRLFRRTTRSVTLTEAGAAYLPGCRQALAVLEQAALDARGEESEPHGNLVVSAPLMFGRLHVRPILSALLARHPQLKVQLTLTDRVTRLVEEGFDAGFRVAQLPDSALHAVRLGEVRRVLVASPSYLEQRGLPASIATLKDHDLIGFEAQTPSGEWRFGGERRLGIHIEPRLWVNDAAAAIDAATDGGGITRVLSYQVAEHVSAGKLVRLLDSFAPAPLPVSLVFQANRMANPNMRALIEHSKTLLSKKNFA